MRISVPLLVIIFCLVCQPVQAAGCRCGNEIISLGDSKAEVLAACGQPAYKYLRSEEIVTRKYEKSEENIDEPDASHKEAIIVYDDLLEYNNTKYLLVNKRQRSVEIEEWTYDFGPNQFGRTLIFKRGEVAAIKVGDYGTRDDKSGQAPHGFKTDLGLTIGEALAKWGEPASIDKYSEEETTRDYLEGAYLYVKERIMPINIEKWTYNFGPNRYTQILIFKNNRLVSSESGERGY